MNALLRSPLLTALLAVSAAAALVACDKPSTTTPGQKLDGAIADVKSGTQTATEQAKAGASELAKDTKQAANSVAATAADATITAKINAALAADDRLSAFKIDVDTEQGRVKLQGTAPDEASKDRASTMAKAVEGVSAVDNRLMVTSK